MKFSVLQYNYCSFEILPFDLNDNWFFSTSHFEPCENPPSREEEIEQPKRPNRVLKKRSHRSCTECEGLSVLKVVLDSSTKSRPKKSASECVRRATRHCSITSVVGRWGILRSDEPFEVLAMNLFPLHGTKLVISDMTERAFVGVLLTICTGEKRGLQN